MVQDSFPTPGTPEWGLMNQRRCELIERDIQGQLSAEEARELAWIEGEALAMINRTVGRPALDWELLRQLDLSKGFRADLNMGGRGWNPC